MEKKTGLILGGILLFSLVLVGVVMAATSEEGTATARVTVNAFVDITITDTDSDGINFGSLELNTDNNPGDGQVAGSGSTTGAATITRQATSNTDILVRLKGSDFTDGTNTLAITNVDYDDDGAVDETPNETTLAQRSLSTNYPSDSGTGDPYATLTGTSPDLKVWFWLDVPSGQAAGSYTSTFSFEGNSA